MSNNMFQLDPKYMNFGQNSNSQGFGINVTRPWEKTLDLFNLVPQVNSTPINPSITSPSIDDLRNQGVFLKEADKIKNKINISKPDYSNLFNNVGLSLSMMGLFSGNDKLMRIGLTGNSLILSINYLKGIKGKTGDLKTVGAMGAAGAIADLGSSLLGRLDNSALTSGLNNAYDAVGNSLMAFSPVGTIMGGAMKVGGFIGDGLLATGVGTDLMTTTDQLLDSNFLKLTPMGLINGLGAKKTQDFAMDTDTIEKVGGSYQDSVDDITNANNKANKKYGLISSKSRRKADRLIDNAWNLLNLMAKISNEALDRRILGNQSDINSLNYNNQLAGGYDARNRLYAKEGGKLSGSWEPEIITFKEGGNIKEDWQPEIITSFKEGGSLDAWLPEILEFKDGGKVSPKTLKNVIPEGNLHARLHHMDNDSNITKKGIPVIDNDGEQLAEIELNEIIFTLEVTKKLEDFYKKFYNSESTQKEKDEVAIEAGKLLVDEILFNTDDRTGLIDTLKQGGTINARF